MSGVKGRSGRLPNLEQRTINELFRFSSATLFHALRDPNYSREHKVEIAARIVLKRMPTKVEGGEGLTNNLLLLFAAQSVPKNELEAKLAVLTGKKVALPPEQIEVKEDIA